MSEVSLACEVYENLLFFSVSSKYEPPLFSTTNSTVLERERKMTDEQFTLVSRAMATAYSDTVARSGMSPDDATNLAGASLAEIMAQQLGVFGAVNRLRDLADVLEKQALEEAREV